MTLFAFLDIETTGLSPDDDHILEIAWLITDSKLETLTPMRSHISEHSQGEWQDIWSQLQSNELVRHMHQESGLLNAIRSHKAWPLSASALLFRDDIENAGGVWEDAPCVRDGNIVTSRTPDDLPAFMQGIFEALGQPT